MNSDKIIIYDDSCPLCAAYTNGFIAAGMIKKENRKNFSTIEPEILNLLDLKRCPNEIPVVDSEKNKVYYGIDGITAILEEKIPAISKIVNIGLIRWPLDKLYKLISYNRRVIVASKNANTGFDCTPDFNFKYRIIFMLLFLVFNTTMLLPVRNHILVNSVFSMPEKQLQVAHFFLVSVNIMIALSIEKKMGIEYLGQINMLALGTILLMIPLILINKYQVEGIHTINHIYLFLLLLFVCREYKRRMDFAMITNKYPIIPVLNITGIALFILYLLY